MFAPVRFACFAIPCLTLALVGCGGSQPAEPATPTSAAPSAAPTPSTAAPVPAPAPEAAPSATAPEPATAPAASAAPSKPDWDSLTVEQKKEIMKTQVLPHMKGLFHDFDAKRFSQVTCMTCHGSGVKEGKFTMPNPKLPKLDPKNDFAKQRKKNAKIVDFMTQHVAPDMAGIIGEAPYDPATQKGFGCFNCHTMAK